MSKQYYGKRTRFLARSNGLQFNMPSCICLFRTFIFSLHKNLIDGLELCGLLVDYVMFLSAVWTHPFTVEELLVSKWCNATFLFSWRNKLIYILDGLQVNLKQIGWIICYTSFLDSHSDGTHSLQRTHWWASDVMLHFSKPFFMKK